MLSSVFLHTELNLEFIYMVFSSDNSRDLDMFFV